MMGSVLVIFFINDPFLIFVRLVISIGALLRLVKFLPNCF